MIWVVTFAAALAWPSRHVLGLRMTARPVRGTRRRGDREQRLVELVDLIGVAVAAGVPPHRAVAAAVPVVRASFDGAPLIALDELAAAAMCGDDLGTGWDRLAEAMPAASTRAVASAWRLSEAIGCPLAAALTVAANLGRDSVDRQRRRKVALAGPRASMVLLAGLPVLGILLASALGADVLSVYAGPLALVTAVPGGALIGLGLFVSRLLVRRASRDAVVSA